MDSSVELETFKLLSTIKTEASDDSLEQSGKF